jgi:uncharacterized membrane protein
MPIVTTLVGAVLGMILGRGFDGAFAGGFVGFIAGLVFNSWRKSRSAATSRASARARGAEATDPFLLLDPRVAERMQSMERRIAALEAALRGAAIVAVPSATAEAVQPIAAPAAPLPEPVEQAAVPVAGIDADAVVARGATAAAQPRRPTRPSIPAYAAARTAHAASATREPSALWRWIAGGNTLARVGVVVLFIGVAFLLKYATEHVSVPIEVRLAAVALGGIVLLVLGWRLRASRTGYAMSLQGAAIGILYLTVFAALRLYQLLPPVAAVVLLLWIAALSFSPFARTRCRSRCSASSAASRRRS